MVKNARYYYTGSAIYPGIYQPVFTKEQEPVKIRGSKPPVNIIEFPDYYQIEMPAPGFQKDDFLVKTQGCSLLVAGYHKCPESIEDARYHRHGFRSFYIARNIDLPADADPEFGTAELKNGVLYVYLYKTNYAVNNHQSYIIVY